MNCRSILLSCFELDISSHLDVSLDLWRWLQKTCIECFVLEVCSRSDSLVALSARRQTISDGHMHIHSQYRCSNTHAFAYSPAPAQPLHEKVTGGTPVTVGWYCCISYHYCIACCWRTSGRSNSGIALCIPQWPCIAMLVTDVYEFLRSYPQHVCWFHRVPSLFLAHGGLFGRIIWLRRM